MSLTPVARALSSLTTAAPCTLFHRWAPSNGSGQLLLLSFPTYLLPVLPFFLSFLPSFISLHPSFTFSFLFLSPFVFSSLFSLPSSLLYQYIFPYTVYHSLFPFMFPSFRFILITYICLSVFLFSLLPLSVSLPPVFLRCSSLCALICVFHSFFLRFSLLHFLRQLPQFAQYTTMQLWLFPSNYSLLILIDKSRSQICLRGWTRDLASESIVPIGSMYHGNNNVADQGQEIGSGMRLTQLSPLNHPTSTLRHEHHSWFYSNCIPS